MQIWGKKYFFIHCAVYFAKIITCTYVIYLILSIQSQCQTQYALGIIFFISYRITWKRDKNIPKLLKIVSEVEIALTKPYFLSTYVSLCYVMRAYLILKLICYFGYLGLQYSRIFLLYCKFCHWFVLKDPDHLHTKNLFC